MKKFLATFIFLLTTNTVFAVSVVDDEDNIVELSKPAQRVITLAPSLTEMIYSIGAEDRLVATVQFSDFPAEAKDKPRIGNYERFVMERLLSFQPDLVVAWLSVNNGQQLKQLEKLGIPVYRSGPEKLSDISHTIKNLGILVGQQERSNQVANEFDNRLESIRNKNKHKRVLNAFYQVWHKPIYTVNGKDTISKIMRLCRLKNVFENAMVLAPKVTVESVVKHNPEIIIAGDNNSGPADWVKMWSSWPTIQAVKNNNLFYIDPDLIHRQSIRILDAAEIMCKQADSARMNIKKNRDQTH